jgi:hypothetical protein
MKTPCHFVRSTGAERPRRPLRRREPLLTISAAIISDRYLSIDAVKPLPEYRNAWHSIC